jgi:hypothetical protein
VPGLVLTQGQIDGALPLAYPRNENKAADIVCIIFIFVYAMGYSLGLGPAAWVYSSEVSCLVFVIRLLADDVLMLYLFRSSQLRFERVALTLLPPAAP